MTDKLIDMSSAAAVAREVVRLNAENARLREMLDQIRALNASSKAVVDGIGIALGEKDYALQRALDPMPCGHPGACATTNEATQYCRWCADLARKEEE